uniref:Uncharacterized protein n=1 Tax=virus sp. ctah610 TaxID=2826807 RepID=A0A8S5R6K9_9VIRU|nr:MAG TPA: hypothetical protein [virus sp. ctah610]
MRKPSRICSFDPTHHTEMWTRYIRLHLIEFLLILYH